MNYKHHFPRYINRILFNTYKERVGYIVESVKKDLFPILTKFGLMDDNHVNKYITCESCENIYLDIIKNPYQKPLINYLKQTDDFWMLFSGKVFYEKDDNMSTDAVPKLIILRPGDKDFEFKKLPCGCIENGNLLVNAITYKNGNFIIDKAKIEELCVVHPTEKQKAAYDLCAQFCEDLQRIGCGDKQITQILTWDMYGHAKPNIDGIALGSRYYFR